MADTQKPVLVKKSRKRFKKLFPQIREQMEFYFSDANLQKDRFLKQKVAEAENGYIDLELFLKFNKLRQLVTDVETLARALKRSEFLQLNEERTKVRRTTAICSPTDVDERTVYVECLPLRADHDWLKDVFSACGRVVYVSLPRYKSTGDIKGFAFVEFESVKAAQLACEMMNNPPATVPERPGKFPKSKETRRLERQLELRQGGHVRKRRASESQVDDNQSPVDKPPAKRRRTVSECRGGISEDFGNKSVDESADKQNNGHKSTTKFHSAISDESPAHSKKDPDVKRRKEKRPATGGDVESKEKRRKSDADLSASETAKTGDGAEMTCETVVGKRGRDGNDHANSDEKVANKSKDANKFKDMSADDVPKKKKKKKNKNDKAKAKDIPELRVISKRMWMQLRSEYLSLQKANMAELKKSLQALKQKHSPKYAQPHDHDASSKGKTQAVKDESQTTSHQSSSALVFSPGVIVHVSSEQPLTRKDLKAQLSTLGNIAYIDLVDGNNQGHVRCSDPSSASSIVAGSVPGCSLQLLSGDAEKMYWDKAIADRERKLNSGGSKTKRRGRDKILQQVDKVQSAADNERRKHIVFDD